MAGNKVYITLEVDDKGTAVVRGFDKNTEQAFNKMKTHAKASTTSMGASLQKLKSHWLAVTAAAAAVIATIGKVLKKFATWEVSLTDMKKVTSESLTSIKQKIMGIHPAIGTSIELVKGYYQVISAGVKDPAKALKVLITASKTAKAAHVDQSEVIKGLTKVMAGYEGQIKDVSEAADLLFAIEKEGQTTVSELIPVIGSLAKISHDLGIAQDEMGASLALITQTAGSTAEAATQYQGVLMALMKPTDAMKKAIKEMGFESAEAAIKQIGLAETLKRLKESTGGSAEKMAELFQRVEGLKAMSALAANGFVILTDKVEAMKKKTGSAADAWDDYKETATSAWDALKASVDKVTIAVGTGLAPAAKELAYWLSDAAEYWTKLFRAGAGTQDYAAEMLEDFRKRAIAIKEELLEIRENIKTPGGADFYYGGLDQAHKKAQELHTELALIEKKIAFLTQPKAAELPAAPTIPTIETPSGGGEPSSAWYTDKEQWAEYMAEKTASFALLKQEQQSAHDFALLLAQDEVEKRIEHMEFMEELKAELHQEELARYEEVMAANEKYMREFEANERKKAEISKQAAIILLHSWTDAFAQLAKGSETAFAFWKATAIAETIIDTYAAAQAAYKAMAGIPVVGPALAIAAAAAAIAAGMARVSAIKSQEPAAMYHTGGIVGRGSRPTRMVSPDIFIGAQRAHTGLGPDERPIIVKNDEGIFTKEQMAAMGRGASLEERIDNHVHVYLDGKEILYNNIHKLKTSGIMKKQFKDVIK